MFITIQFPFIDLRSFFFQPPAFVPRYPPFDEAQDTLPDQNAASLVSDFKRRIIDRHMFIRSFGKYRCRGYFPDFRSADEIKNASEPEDNAAVYDEAQKESISTLWKDEYLYASTRRGLRFVDLEKNKLANGKLVKPRVLIRAIRLSPYEQDHLLWSPSIRIEIGILYTVTQPIDGKELLDALADFVKMQVKVRRYRVNGAGKHAVVEDQGWVFNPLIEQQQALAALIVKATTDQCEQVHPQMVRPGQPLLTVHYFPGELASMPANHLPVPTLSSQGCQAAFVQMKSPNAGVWIFNVPSPSTRSEAASQRREKVRNTTIAVLRYWSELQAALELRNALTQQTLGLLRQDGGRISGYYARTNELFNSRSWHGADLATIRNVVNTYNCELPCTQSAMEVALERIKGLHGVAWQLGQKMRTVGESNPAIFVSYSHLDTRYIQHLQKAFAGPEFAEAYFDDTFIQPGQQWEPLLKRRIEGASIAILLISPNFHASKYIGSLELKLIESKVQRQLMHVLAVLIDGEIPSQGFLERDQFVNTHPLSNASPKDLQRVFDQLPALVRNWLSEPRQSPDPASSRVAH